MRVLTLGQKDFEEKCGLLADMLSEDAPYDMVIGIASGGVNVARSVAPLLEGNPSIVSVRLQRPSTRRKGILFERVIQVLPRFILDPLRIIESLLLSCKTKSTKPLPGVNLPEAVRSAHRILIIDDAIDSGRTMAAVAKGVKQFNPEAQIVTAVITVTTKNPVIKPDYTLFADGTLIRFPWSADA